MSKCPKDCNKKEKCCGVSKVVIPAALGDENGEYKPENGAYFNTLVEYQASGVSYLYSNDGIPTRMGDGIVATIEVGETTTLQPGESATVENTGDKYHAVLNFGIPEGQKGDTGDAATVEVGTTTTSAPGSDASVTNSGDEHNAVLDFVIPRGSQGPQGVPGQAATIQVGTVTTLDPDQDATVVNSGTTSAAVFNFGIPKGDKGDTGSVSSEVVTELPVPGDDSKLYLMEKDSTVETADGAAFTIQNAATDGEMRLTELTGNATQNGTPTPDAPVAINTTTGENVVRITGKNLFDISTATMANLYMNVNGWTMNASDWIGTSSFVKVSPNTTYTISSSANSGTRILVNEYTNTDANTFISPRVETTNTGGSWTTTSTTKYIRFSIQDANATNIQLELGSTATAFEPYQGQEFPIDLGSIELAKIGDYQDRIYKNDGKWYVEKQVGKVDLATLTWTGGTVNQGYIWATTGFPNVKYVSSNTELGAVMATNYTPHIGQGMWETHGFIAIDTARVAVSDNSGSPKGSAYYALATPTTTEITDSTLLAQLNFIANLYGGTNNIMLVGTGAQGEIGVEYQTWEKYNRYDVYIWNDQIGDYQILNS